MTPLKYLPAFLLLLLLIACGDEPIEPGPIVLTGGRPASEQSPAPEIAPEGPAPTPLPENMLEPDTSGQSTTQTAKDSVNIRSSDGNVGITVKNIDVTVVPAIGTDAWYAEVGKRSGVIDTEGHGPDPKSQEWFAAVSRKTGVMDSQGHGPDFDSDEWRNAVHKKMFGKKPVGFDKIKFELNKLDYEGLQGPPDGKRALDYEFAIPDTPENRAAVRAIDPSVKFMPGSKGRVGAGEGQVLCIGSTHQENYRAILLGLARLDFIDRIIECHYE